jgi:uncharacterized protein with HEPN domain
MNPDIKKYLFDSIDSIEIIESHLKNIKDLSAYKADIKTIDAVERRLAIIGEAIWKADKLQDININNKPKIIGLRHILIHDYDLIEDETIWTICKKYLPELKDELKKLLG